MIDQKSTSGRLLSIDAVRGYAMFFVVGGQALFLSLAKGTGDPALIERMDKLFAHVQWHGLSYADTIFPMFLFISGLSFPFSLARREELGGSRGDLYLMIARRCLTLILLGLVYNGLLSGFNFAGIRYCSVLGRIGLAWAIAAIIYLNTKRPLGRVLWILGILVSYWLLLSFVSAPDMPGADSLSMEGNISGYVDRLLFPGHLYNEYYDPEGLVSTVASSSTVLMGMLTGQFLLWERDGLGKGKKALCLLAAGLLLMALGFLWSRALPINKRLWTSSYNCVTCGAALVTFGLFYALIEMGGWTRWAFPFLALGKNALVAYLGYQVFNGFEAPSRFLLGGVASLFPDSYSKFFTILGGVLTEWVILCYLYRKNASIKI